MYQVPDGYEPHHRCEKAAKVSRSQTSGGVVEPDGAHPAAEVTSEGRRDDGVHGGEHGAHSHTMGNMQVRHRGDVLDDVGLGGDSAELLQGAVWNVTSPYVNWDVVLARAGQDYSGHGSPPSARGL